MKKLLLSLVLISSLSADDLEMDLDGFGDDSDIKSSEEYSGADLDGFGDGFDDSEGDSSDGVEEKEYFTLSGNVAFKTALSPYKHKVDGVEYQGINQAQSALYLQFDSKLSDDWKVRISGDAYYDAIYDFKDYNRASEDTYKTQLRFDDTYIEGSITSHLDLKVGRQIVVWGKSDSIRITDVINPLDNRLLGMTDIEDLRLSTTMAKLDYYVGEWDLSAMLIVESRTLLEAEARSEFFPVDTIFPQAAPRPFIELNEPTTSVSNLQYALAANGVFSGWDLSFYGADVYDSKWHIDPATKKREISKIQMLGSAVNIAYGSWLLKSEVAFINGVKYNATLDDKQRLDLLVGFDYMGVSDTVISLEMADRHIFDYESQMEQSVTRPDYLEEDELQTALRVSRTFINDTLNINALGSLFGKQLENGGFARVWVDYEVANSLNASVGYVDYIEGEKAFLDAISKNDRLFADITYSF